MLAEDNSDVLVNVNLIDDEKAEQNRDNKRKLAGLGGIAQDEDEDVLMGLREKGVLEKYDAEISGPKKTEFTLEAGGTYATDHERALHRLNQELQSNRVRHLIDLRHFSQIISYLLISLGLCVL